MYNSNCYLNFRTDLFANTFFNIVQKHKDAGICNESILWVPFDYLLYEDTITIKYMNQHNETLTLILKKDNEVIKATTVVKEKYLEDGTDSFYFVDTFQEIMFDDYFLKD